MLRNTTVAFHAIAIAFDPTLFDRGAGPASQENKIITMLRAAGLKELNLENNYIRAAGKQALAVLRESAAGTDLGPLELWDDWQMPARG